MSLLNTAKRGLTLAKIGWTLRKLGDSYSEAERALAQRHLVNLFSQARGVTMKVGQLWSDAASETEFNTLVDNIEPLPLSRVQPEIEAALGKSLSSAFSRFDESKAAASLGQVHYAELIDGTPVAVKVRYPDIAAAVDSEMEIAGLMPNAGPVKKWGVDYTSYLRTLKANMDHELNYLFEAQTQRDYAQQVSVRGLRVPRVYFDLCRENVLVQDWIEGVKLDSVRTWASNERQAVASILLGTLFVSLFEVGTVHGDPHFGNYRFNIEKGRPVVGLLDFGCTVTVSRTERLALLKLIFALKENRPESALACFIAMGFDGDKLAKISRSLPMLCRILFRPFLAADKFRIQDWRVKQDIEQLLGERKWWFRSAGPANLLLLLRAFQGLAEQLSIVQGFLPWWEILKASLSAQTIREAHEFVLPAIPQNLQAETSVDTLAKTLHVKVSDQGRVKATVSLPAELALDLKSVIPSDVLAQLQADTQLNLDGIVSRVIESGVAPQLVFDYAIGTKKYRVWLE